MAERRAAPLSSSTGFQSSSSGTVQLDSMSWSGGRFERVNIRRLPTAAILSQDLGPEGVAALALHTTAIHEQAKNTESRILGPCNGIFRVKRDRADEDNRQSACHRHEGERAGRDSRSSKPAPRTPFSVSPRVLH